ncbi:protein-glucosylgalactosylhydroxylysine glucosidase-like [Gigantopelta aegis]|uniref:protein-glucosylgalactosylhydroxylysine glucosidase-like n=1 Tax=Gigantopelta aegis TaxID=1735272 RepID=UPI001B88E5DD|nr:protein-glucosylgalactosylhydroxylysine glucosidase-like [Gigantopelta aegis]
MARGMTADGLLSSHSEAWENLWSEGRIELSGNLDVAQTINAGLYFILSSTPLVPDDVNPFKGLSPGGLSRGGITRPDKSTAYNDYIGHVFWDMDTWIMPPIMMLHPQLAKIMIGSRTHVLDVVRRHAQTSGYKGVRYPWEQGVTGEEVCPWEPAAVYQIHVTADISYSLRQYLYATHDSSILSSGKGFELAMEIARFWQSRANKTSEDVYEIFGVMGPDENHFNIDNSVFTNYNAKLSLLLPAYIRDNYRIKITAAEHAEIDSFTMVAPKLIILYDDKRKYHPQFEGFSLNATIKQSDVVLLGYPLLMPMSPEIRRNDLEIYTNLTDVFGPDTGTWSMYALTRLELGEEARADRDFHMMLRNINGPFKIFSEKPETGPQGVRCVNFITGAGGLLQGVIFGYGGLRLDADHLTVSPHLLPQTNHWAIRGLHYRDFTLDLEVFHTVFRIVVRDVAVAGGRISIVDKDDREIRVGESISKTRAPVKISVSDSPKDKATSKGSGLYCKVWLASLMFVLHIAFRVNEVDPQAY